MTKRKARYRQGRGHFVRRISDLLARLASKAGQATMAPIVADLFFIIRDYGRQSPADPFVDVVMGLHDALAANDFWLKAKKEQYEGANVVLSKFGSRNNLSPSSIDSAVGALEDMGFDTTPYIGNNSMSETSEIKFEHTYRSRSPELLYTRWESQPLELLDAGLLICMACRRISSSDLKAVEMKVCQHADGINYCIRVTARTSQPCSLEVLRRVAFHLTGIPQDGNQTS